VNGRCTAAPRDDDGRMVRRALAALVVVATTHAAAADSDTPYLDLSLWGTGGLVGAHDLGAEGQLAIGFRHAEGRDEGRVGAWLEAGTGTVLGVEGEVDRAVMSTDDLRLGGRVGVGVGGESVWYSVGARVRYREVWLGVDLARLNAQNTGDPTVFPAQTQLDVGAGFDLHPKAKSLAIAGGIVAGIVVLAVAVVAASFAGEHGE
jgi:hypothetical protein